jgi:hypothetical protein
MLSAILLDFLETLLKVGGEWRDSIRYASLGRTRRRDRRALFQGTKQRGVYDSTLQYGDESVARAHPFNMLLLPLAKYFYGQSFEVAEYP